MRAHPQVLEMRAVKAKLDALKSAPTPAPSSAPAPASVPPPLPAKDTNTRYIHYKDIFLELGRSTRHAAIITFRMIRYYRMKADDRRVDVDVEDSAEAKPAPG